MDGKEIQARLMRQFDLIFRERGRGTQISLTRAMGVQDNYFARIRNEDLRLTWDRLGQALEILEIEPFEFFARALKPEHLTSSELEKVLPKSTSSSGIDLEMANSALKALRERGFASQRLEDKIKNLKQRVKTDEKQHS